jgi:hypothetical protein
MLCLDFPKMDRFTDDVSSEDSSRLVVLDDGEVFVNEHSSLTHTGKSWNCRWCRYNAGRCTPQSLKPYLTWENIKVRVGFSVITRKIFLCLFVTVLGLCFFTIVDHKEEELLIGATSSMMPFISFLLVVSHQEI